MIFLLLRAHPGHGDFALFVLNRIGYPNAYQHNWYYARFVIKTQALSVWYDTNDEKGQDF